MKKVLIAVIIAMLLGGGAYLYLDSNKIEDTLSYATWDQLSDDTRDFFASFYEGDMDEGKVFYNDYFMKYNPVHEVSHSLQDKYNVESNFYEKEASVNNVAVAYWREIGETDFIDSLEVRLRGVLAQLEDPTPEGRDPVEYFNAERSNLGKEPRKYGYYQFSWVLNAIEKEETLYEALKQNISIEATAKTSDLELSHDDPSVIDPIDVVSNYTQYIKLYNIESVEIKFDNTFSPSIQSIH